MKKKGNELTSAGVGSVNFSATSDAANTALYDTNQLNSFAPTPNSAPRVLYPVLTIRELKQLKQQANQYTANMNRLKLRAQGGGGALPTGLAGSSAGSAGIHNRSELKSFSGVQVLNVGSILLRPSSGGSAGGGSSGLLVHRGPRRDSQRIPAVAAVESAESNNLMKVAGRSVKVKEAKETSGGRDDEIKLLLKESGGVAAVSKKRAFKKDTDASMLTLSGYNDKIADLEPKLTENGEDEDEDKEEEEVEEEEEEEEEAEDDDEEEDDEDDEDDEEDCDNCKCFFILYRN